VEECPTTEFLKENYYVKIGNVPEFEDKFFKVKTAEPFTYETGTSDTAEFSAVASGSKSGFKNIEVLEPDDSPFHLFQVRWGVQDGCKYWIKIPTGTNRLGVDEDKDVGYITNTKSPYYAPNELYEIWLIHDFYPAIDAENITPSSLTPKVWFEGMKYDLEEVKDTRLLAMLKAGDIPSRTITIGGVKTTE
jgi:hypothetical protein